MLDALNGLSRDQTLHAALKENEQLRDIAAQQAVKVTKPKR